MEITPIDPKIIEKLRQKYIKNPPEGMTAKLVRNVTDSDLSDMQFFLTEDDDLDDNEFRRRFLYFLITVCFLHPPLCGLFLFKSSTRVELSIKQDKFCPRRRNHLYLILVQRNIVYSFASSSIKYSTDTLKYFANNNLSVSGIIFPLFHSLKKEDGIPVFFQVRIKKYHLFLQALRVCQMILLRLAFLPPVPRFFY